MFKKFTEKLILDIECGFGSFCLNASIRLKRMSDTVARDVYKKLKHAIEVNHPDFLLDEEFAEKWNEIVEAYEG